MSKAYECAVRLLSRREHGAKELADKLTQKGYEEVAIAEVLSKCQHLGLQSDLRYTESLCRRRIQQGYGPLRIRQELQTKNIAIEHIESVLIEMQDCWAQHAQAAWKKKFKNKEDKSYTELQKQKRFLQYRGFSHDVIAMIIDE